MAGATTPATCGTCGKAIDLPPGMRKFVNIMGSEIKCSDECFSGDRLEVRAEFLWECWLATEKAAGRAS